MIGSRTEAESAVGAYFWSVTANAEGDPIAASIACTPRGKILKKRYDGAMIKLPQQHKEIPQRLARHKQPVFPALSII
jgi:hypothetical protein